MSKKLIAPAGTSEASVGTNLYVVDAEGTVTVTDEDAVALLDDETGFVLPDAPPVSDPGRARIKSPNNDPSISFDGVEYFAEADGTFVVPVLSVAEFVSHGFTQVFGTTILPTE